MANGYVDISGLGGGGGAAIGEPVDGGTPDRVLYLDSSGNLAVSSNLEFDGTNLISGNYVLTPNEFDVGNSGSTKTITFSNGSAQKITMTASCTFTLASPQIGGAYVLKFVQTSAGAYTYTWPATVLWPNGAPPTGSATGKADLINLYWDGTNYFGSFSLNYLHYNMSLLLLTPFKKTDFSPFDLPGLQLWLDPNDPAFRSGTTKLLDKSGNGNNFTGTATMSSFVAGPNGTTINQQGVVGSTAGSLLSSGYNGPALTSFEVWFVCKRNSELGSAAFARVLTFANKFSLGFHLNPSFGPFQIVMHVGTDYKAAVTLDLTTFHIYRAVYNAGTWSVYQDGVSKTVTSAGDYAPLEGASSRIGSGEYTSAWYGDDGDMIVVSQVLSSDDANSLTEYLQTKYGLS